MATLQFLAAPFVACLVLVGIHSYLGQHVLRRQVIFVDLALAQIAALGGVVAFSVGLEPATTGAALFSLGFAILGAGLFALTRARYEIVPQEAVIGITFVVASAAAILVAARAPDGAEHIQETLAGSILWVRWPDVTKSAVIYAVVGAFHFAFRRSFILISEDPAEAYRRGMHVRAWDFAFYVSFGVVITLSVKMAGILMVFSYLVMPAAMALLICEGWGARLAAGYVMGTLGSLVGFVLSYRLDVPSGPAVVCSLAGMLVVTAVWHALTRRRQAQVRPMAGLAGFMAVALVALVVYLLLAGNPTREHLEEHAEGGASLAVPAEGASAEDAAPDDRRREREACRPLVVLAPGETFGTLARDCYGGDLGDALRRFNEATGQIAPGQTVAEGDVVEIPDHARLRAWLDGASEPLAAP